MTVEPSEERREELGRLLRYFWTEKGDIESLSGFSEQEVEHYFPEVMLAWRNYKRAERVMNAVIKGLDL